MKNFDLNFKNSQFKFKIKNLMLKHIYQYSKEWKKLVVMVGCTKKNVDMSDIITPRDAARSKRINMFDIILLCAL